MQNFCNFYSGVFAIYNVHNTFCRFLDVYFKHLNRVHANFISLGCFGRFWCTFALLSRSVSNDRHLSLDGISFCFSPGEKSLLVLWHFLRFQTSLITCHSVSNSMGCTTGLISVSLNTMLCSVEWLNWCHIAECIMWCPPNISVRRVNHRL